MIEVSGTYLNSSLHNECCPSETPKRKRRCESGRETGPPEGLDLGVSRGFERSLRGSPTRHGFLRDLTISTRSASKLTIMVVYGPLTNLPGSSIPALRESHQKVFASGFSRLARDYNHTSDRLELEGLPVYVPTVQSVVGRSALEQRYHALPALCAQSNRKGTGG